ncbi:MAG TPA: DNA-3-methyladenine glycosylase 2 family protein [Acidimicrobiia bacterium]
MDVDGWWRTARTPEGPATLRLERVDDGIRATAWGSGADWILERVPEWIGLHDEPEGLVTDHRVVGPLARRHRGLRFGATGLVFDALVIAIVSQKVAGKEAGMSLRQLWRRFGDPAPGPRPLRLPPDPERMADAPYWEYHPLGIERRRAEVLRKVAADHHRIERLAEVPSADTQRWLQRYRGVGEWTAAETVAISHGDADAVSVGDYHHKHIVAWHLTGRPRGTDEEMLELLEPFRPHRGRVVRLLTILGHEPAFGPRMPLRRIANA